MKKLALWFVLTCALFPIFSQVDSTRSNPRNTLFLELSGNAVLWSMNYERLLLETKHGNMLGRAGGSYTPFGLNFSAAVIEIYWKWGISPSFLELGSGLSWLQGLTQEEFLINPLKMGHSEHTTRSSTVYLVPRFAYRYQKNARGIFYKLSLVPLFKIRDMEPSFNSSSMATVGLAVGFNF
jgi:hypothetical protein